MNVPGETRMGAEGEIARNSQAKGPEWDETLESRKAPKKQSPARVRGESFRRYEQRRVRALHMWRMACAFAHFVGR